MDQGSSNKPETMSLCYGQLFPCNVTSGVPQGSVLGPILFIIYINDLPEVVQSKLEMFAENTKMFHTISSDEDYISFQNNLNNIMKW